jgi:hypothetical protein
MRNRFWLCLVSTVLWLGACGSSPNECSAGQACAACIDNAACGRTCLGTGCSFECDGNGSCNFQCDKGGCTATNNGNGSLNLSCPGGNCSVHCLGNGTCNISGCPSCACSKPTGGQCSYL